jgi:hypothetical protein
MSQQVLAVTVVLPQLLSALLEPTALRPMFQSLQLLLLSTPSALLTLEQQVLQRLQRQLSEVLVTLVQLQQLPTLCLVHWELTSSLQDKAAVLVAPSLTVRGEALHTPQQDYFSPVGQAAAAVQLAREATSQHQRLRPLS